MPSNPSPRAPSRWRWLLSDHAMAGYLLIVLGGGGLFLGIVNGTGGCAP